MCNVQTGLDKTLTVELSWEVWNPVHDSALESSSQDSLRALQKKKKKSSSVWGKVCMLLRYSQVWICCLQMTTIKDETSHYKLAWDTLRSLKVTALPTHSLEPGSMLQ